MKNVKEFPETVLDRLLGICVAGRSPAYLAVDRKGLLQRSGGNCQRYGLRSLRKGRPMADVLDCLVGLFPFDGDETCLPLVQVGDRTFADVHVLDAPDGCCIVLLDASAEAVRLQALQQSANELSLMREAQERMMRLLQAGHADCLAILDQLEIITAIIGQTGKVEFLSASGQKRFCCQEDRAAGVPWRVALPFSNGQLDEIKVLLDAAPSQRRRLRLDAAVMPDGRRCCFDLDISDDPRGEGKRILYFYDVSELYDLRELLKEKGRFHDLIGQSKVMSQVFMTINDLAGVTATVLIEGETGTGKELVARAIHYSSSRKDAPFIIVNCAGLSGSLINSQLFGHRKGSFTDAVRDQVGLFESANGGTIFLDEIGDIPMDAQTRILRVLENRELTRVGEAMPRKVDIRVLAATNKDLQTEIDQGRFRIDLLYRVRVARVQLPPLRKRRDDIPLLVALFLSQSNAATGKGVERIDDDVMHLFLDYPWPGNVRELRNTIEFAVVRCKGGTVKAGDLPPEFSAPALVLPSRRPYLIDEERGRMLQALEQTNGNRLEAAKLLGISRSSLYRRLRECFPKAGGAIRNRR